MSLERVRPPKTFGFRLSSAASPALQARELLAAAFYHRRVLLLAFVVPALLGLVAASGSHTEYVGDARLMIRYGSEFFYAPAAQPSGGVVLDRNQVILGELQILQSAELASETLESVGAGRVYPGSPAASDTAVRRFIHDLTVTSIPQSNVVDISFRNRDPDVAVDVLTALIAKYLARRTAVFEKPSLQDADTQRAALGRELDAAENELAEFARAHGITNLDQQLNLLVQQNFTIAASKRDTDAAISDTQARFAIARQQLALIPRHIRIFSEYQRSQQLHAATEALITAQNELTALRTHFGANAPQVLERQRQVGALEQELSRAPAREGVAEREGDNPLYNEFASRAAALEAELQGLRARRADLDADAAALTQPLAQLNLAAQRYGELKRRRDLLDETYRTFSRDLGQARVSDAIERSPQANIRVLQQPQRPAFGENPRLTLAFGGVALGLLSAAATFALLQWLRPVVLSARETELALGLPVLATVALKPGAFGDAPLGRIASSAWSSVASPVSPAE